ncbi:transcriptional activator ARO80 [Fusarium beomiforme]|uniref:Transcriptional activator ARO80 n=1 Tax=Fusarium beomiforme TaxID=44412 RepID=A0A9P5AT26_9HYPO|nr:transcriptional activator ARO80 [Fusarium beomiforme]
MTPPTGAETEKRVSRACVSCRSRKTRCDLDSSGVPGDPPCRRCIEKNQECILATSRRGGRRIKGQRLGYSRSTNDSHQPSPSRSVNRMNPVPAQESREPDQHSEWLSSNLGSPLDQQSDDDEEPTGDAVRLKGHFTSSDLLNPSDALDLLAHVADMEPEGHAQTQDAEGDTENSTRMANISQGVCDYPPISSGALTLSEAAFLIEHAVFDSSRLLELIEHEPYLITAILTVATKDDPSWSRAHNACARHMETQISKLIYTGSTTVGAVEALLILAEWAPQPLEENLMIGCGKEDQGSWMLVGVAIRLAYLQNLEQTGLVQRVEGAPDNLSRKRIAWAACYMSDRQVSIRLGKGFWSRGPGPSVNLRAADFPYLQTQKLGNDNLALLFQAHLEITQLFSNAHDILYSSTSHREQLYIGGEYVRYIDDFSSVLRRWKLSWGGLSFIPRVKASLMLSYDFLRLYINAFAFQANLNRIVRRSKKRPSGPLFSELAAAPDARFIYESIDAANSILCTLNSFIDPNEAFKYMPLKFYLYVIYAAVFLFKAIFAGAIKPSEARGVRRAIYETISRLQKTSNNQQGLGQRYARSLRLLWLKMLGKSRSRNPEVEGRSDSLALTNHGGALQSQAESSEAHLNSDPFNSFSWKDLHSLGEFISNDGTSLFNDNFIISPEQDSRKVSEMATSQSKDLPSSSFFSGFAANYLQQTGKSTHRVFDLAFGDIQASKPITKDSTVHDNAAGPGIAASVLIDRLSVNDLPKVLVTDNVPPMV